MVTQATQLLSSTPSARLLTRGAAVAGVSVDSSGLPDPKSMLTTSNFAPSASRTMHRRVVDKGGKGRRKTAGDGAGQAAAVPQRFHNEGPVLKGLETADSVGNGFFMAEFILPIGGWLLRNTIGRIPYVGPRFVGAMGNITHAPIEMLKHTTVGELLEKPSVLGTRYKQARVSYFENPDVKARGAKPGAKIAKWKAEHGPLKAVQSRVATVATSGPFQEGFVQKWAAGGARNNLKQLHTDTDAILREMSGQKTGLIDRAAKLVGLGAKEAEGVSQVLVDGHYKGHAIPRKFHPLAEAISNMRAELSKGAHEIDIKAVGKHHQAAHDAFEALSSKAKSELGSVPRTLEEAAGKVRTAGSQLNVARSNKSALQAMNTSLKGATIFDVGLKGGLGLGTLYFGGKTAVSFRDSMRMIKETTKDLTGSAPSTWQVLFNSGSLPKVVQEARGNMMSKFLPEAVSAAASAGLNLVFMKRHLGVKEQAALFGAIMTQYAASEMSPKENFLDSYIAIKDAQAAGQPVPAEMYAALIEAASPHAREAGGMNNRLVSAVALDYATSQTPAKDVLDEIQNNKPYMDRAHRAADKLKQEDAMKHAKPAHNKSLADTAKQPDHVVKAADPHQAAKQATPTVLAASQVEHQGKVVQHQQEVSA